MAEDNKNFQATKAASDAPAAANISTGTGAWKDARADATLHGVLGGVTAVSCESAPAAGRYLLLDEIARGGMGVVYRGTDTVLGREVAVKVLQDKYTTGSAAATRFVDEARISGQLQHPGIPPVHDLGTLSDGRPFLAMKLIKGQTLEQLLQHIHHPLAADERGRLLASFEGVCQAVGYAHAHNVIHRDLKPANVMVGAFGEVQVMDWGLAKVLTGTTVPAIDPLETVGTAIRSLRDSDGSETQAGSVLGTPAYMPPEQAVGAVHLIDARSDVFGLGGILAVILTGSPPFVGASGEDTRVLAARGKVDDCFARLDGCGAEVELIDLCKRCLAPESTDRPSDAGTVAAAVAGFRVAAEDRARRAELDRVRVQGEQATAAAQAAERRKRRQVWAGATTALVLLTVAGLAAIVAVGRAKNAELQAERDAATEQRSLAQTERDAARKAEDQARASQTDADSQRKLAQARLETAVGAVEQVMTRVAGEKWATRPELQAERRQVLEEAVAFFNSLGAGDSRDPGVRRQSARATLLVATASQSLGEYDNSIKSAAAARALYQGLRADFPTDTAYIRGEIEAAALLGHVDAINARFNSALEYYNAVLALAKDAVALEPNRDDNQIALGECHSSLALFYSFQRPDLSKQHHAAALAIGERLLTRPAPGFKSRLIAATALANLGIAEIGKEQDAAAAKFARAKNQIRVLDRLTPPSARAAESFDSLKAGLELYEGYLLVRTGKADEGRSSARAGIDHIGRALAAQPNAFPFQIQDIQFRIIYADLLVDTGRWREAVAEMETVGARQREIARLQPQLSWIGGLGVMQRSNLMIYRLRDRFTPDFELEAKLLLDDNQTNGYAGPGLRYNVACLFAQAAALAPEADRARYADKAIEMLNELLAHTSYFQDASTRPFTVTHPGHKPSSGRDLAKPGRGRAHALRWGIRAVSDG